jgi:hypothetical protein
MSVYIQVGHDSKNLLSVPELNQYAGAILSPVNYTENKLAQIVLAEASKKSFELIFDPQLYYPKCRREILRSWSYFPSDVDTADYSSNAWWNTLSSNLIANTNRLGISSICSPAIVPRSYDKGYFDLLVRVGEMINNHATALNIEVLQTVLVGMNDLANYSNVMLIASILTKTSLKRVYLVLVTDTNPRHELSDADAIKGAMLLIRLLEENGINVLVAYSSSDIVLWKEAGAKSLASGKYFNLRRFTPSRWDEQEEGGGGQQPYWIEESLLTFLRESDIQRINKIGLLSPVSIKNPFTDEILAQVNSGLPWLSVSWKHYLYWFQDIDERINSKVIDPFTLLRNIDNNWKSVEANRVFLEERRNDGNWIRQWLRAVSEYRTPW